MWILVGSKYKDYPYYFLDSESFSVIGVYTAILLANIIFYSVWYGFSELKFYLYSNYGSLPMDEELTNNSLLQVVDEDGVSSTFLLQII